MKKADEKREQAFKEYELEKKAKEDYRLSQMSEQERNKELQENEKYLKAKREIKMKHPGGHEQLADVWENTDHVLFLVFKKRI